MGKPTSRPGGLERRSWRSSGEQKEGGNKAEKEREVIAAAFRIGRPGRSSLAGFSEGIVNGRPNHTVRMGPALHKHMASAFPKLIRLFFTPPIFICIVY